MIVFFSVVSNGESEQNRSPHVTLHTRWYIGKAENRSFPIVCSNLEETAEDCGFDRNFSKRIKDSKGIAKIDITYFLLDCFVSSFSLSLSLFFSPFPLSVSSDHSDRLNSTMRRASRRQRTRILSSLKRAWKGRRGRQLFFFRLFQAAFAG